MNTHARTHTHIHMRTKPTFAACSLTYLRAQPRPQRLPALSSLDFVAGTCPAPKTPLVLVLWANYSEADFGLLVDLSALAKATPSVGVVGVSCDPKRSDVEAFLGRFGAAMPELKIPELRVDFPLAYDPNKEFRTALNEVSGQSKAGVSTTLVVDAEGVIVWKEQFSLMHPLEKGQLRRQLERLLAGEPLVSNGPCPVSAEDEDDGEYDNDSIPDVSDDSDGLLL